MVLILGPPTNIALATEGDREVAADPAARGYRRRWTRRGRSKSEL